MDITEIEPGLWCGAALKEVPSNIHVVVNLTGGGEKAFGIPSGVFTYYLAAPIEDGPFRGIEWLDTTVDLIIRWISEGLNVLIHCAAGISRSVLVTAAVLMKNRDYTRDRALAYIKSKRSIANPNPYFLQGLIEYENYLRPITLMLTGPLVSICVRVKYPTTYLLAMCLCLRRQRYTNWEAIVTTDGPNPEVGRLLKDLGDLRFRLLETKEKKGCWGHYHRDEAISQCKGEWIGLTNDDNYYVPGYLDLMLQAAMTKSSHLVLCDNVHSYRCWNHAPIGPLPESCDLGNWLAKASLVKDLPWPTEGPGACQKYLKLLIPRTGGRVTIVRKPLFIHN